jgi:mannose/fructose/sorbose-specific phosphotransferase system IIA component
MQSIYGGYKVINILVVTHGMLAEGLIHSAKMLIGDAEKVDYLSFEKDMGQEELTEAITQKMKRLATDEQLLIFCDIVGGTPFNVSSRFSFNNEDIAVFYGVNLPVLVEAILTREGKNLQELTAGLVESSKDSLGLSEL